MITADMVKQLRERTGAGMMDCKKALVETDGDLEKSGRVFEGKRIGRCCKKGWENSGRGLS